MLQFHQETNINGSILQTKQLQSSKEENMYVLQLTIMVMFMFMMVILQFVKSIEMHMKQYISHNFHDNKYMASVLH